LRIVDANINRLREGLRVCEDIVRFLLNNRELTTSFKRLRHSLNKILRENSFFTKGDLIRYRDIRKDVGRNIVLDKKKENIFELFSANIQRIEEALRVLEEVFKLLDYKSEEKFRKLRFQTYALEKKAYPIILRYAKRKNI